MRGSYGAFSSVEREARGAPPRRRLAPLVASLAGLVFLAAALVRPAGPDRSAAVAAAAAAAVSAGAYNATSASVDDLRFNVSVQTRPDARMRLFAELTVTSNASSSSAGR